MVIKLLVFMTIMAIILIFLTHSAASSAWHSPNLWALLLLLLFIPFFLKMPAGSIWGNRRSLVNKDKACRFLI